MTTATRQPNLDELRRQLAVPVINTGRQIPLLGHAAGPITDDLEGLHAVADEHGRIRFISGVEFSLQLYRGQTQVYPRCIPTLARCDTTEKQLLALCRRVAFEDAIAEHPMVKLAERVRFLDAPLYVDLEGLAQHYGLATDMLDVTSNFDIACFFATCAWNSHRRRHEPILTNEATGVIYRITPALMISMEQTEEAFGPVHIVGWQPLPRPEQQRAFVVKMKPEQDFTSLRTVETFCFRHEADISHRIWTSFEHGDALFPRDAAAELAQQAEVLSSFTERQIERAWQRLTHWTGTVYNADYRAEMQKFCSIAEIESPSLSWDGLGVETSEERLIEGLNEALSRVRYRRSFSV